QLLTNQRVPLRDGGAFPCATAARSPARRRRVPHARRRRVPLRDGGALPCATAARSPARRRRVPLRDGEKAKSRPSPSQNPKLAAGYPPDPVEPSSANDPELSLTTNSPEGKQARKKKTKSNPSPDQTQRLAADNVQGQKKPKPKLPPNQNKAPAPQKAEDPRIPPNINAISQTRQELMQYNSRITFDHRTAHKKLVISDRYTTLSLADQPQSYADLPERFFNCSQALGLQSFTNGRHYWEVNNDGSSFWAIGIAYSGMDRRGSRSRLGRNLLSWCVESFGQKLSFWHGDQETVLSVQRPRVVGVFLDFETGIVAFYSVTNAVVLLFGFRTVFQGRVHPAFWLSSSGTKLTLVQ
ncbi:E3 ubiquitin/ISG15 ligase TRIM25-like, partial [Cetorhinus maximus]